VGLDARSPGPREGSSTAGRWPAGGPQDTFGPATYRRTGPWSRSRCVIRGRSRGSAQYADLGGLLSVTVSSVMVADLTDMRASPTCPSARSCRDERVARVHAYALFAMSLVVSRPSRRSAGITAQCCHAP